MKKAKEKKKMKKWLKVTLISIGSLFVTLITAAAAIFSVFYLPIIQANDLPRTHTIGTPDFVPVLRRNLYVIHSNPQHVQQLYYAHSSTPSLRHALPPYRDRFSR